MFGKQAFALLLTNDRCESVTEFVVIGLVDAGEGGIADGAPKETHPDAPVANAFLVDRQDQLRELDEIFRLLRVPEHEENILRDVVESGEQHRILVLEIMRDRAGGRIGRAGDIHKPRIVDALLADHRNGGSGNVSTALIMVDLFWHNGDYIKNGVRCNQENAWDKSDETSGEARKKMRRLMKWLAYALASVFAAMTALAVIGFIFFDPPLDSGPLHQSLLDAGETVTPFNDVLPDGGWDTICYIDPYDRVSQDLPRHAGEDFPGFSYLPNDEWVDEEQIGLALIDHEAKTVVTYVLDVTYVQPPDTLSRITGPRCLKRDEAHFMVQRVEARNGSYNHLVFVSDE